MSVRVINADELRALPPNMCLKSCPAKASILVDVPKSIVGAEQARLPHWIWVHPQETGRLSGRLREQARLLQGSVYIRESQRKQASSYAFNS